MNDEKFIDLMRYTLVALEDVMEGGDGWGCETQIGAIDRLRVYLDLSKRCMRCSEDGHTTYSHFQSNYDDNG